MLLLHSVLTHQNRPNNIFNRVLLLCAIYSPIGFGVVVFCIAKSDCHELYERFYEGFAQYGEPNIPIDKGN